MFPDDLATSTNSTRYLPGSYEDPSGGGLVSPDFLVGHQGRVVIFPLTLSSFGTGGEVYVNNEAFYWTEVNDARTRDDSLSGFFNIIAGYENPSGYGAFSSRTADTLLLVKGRGGGLFIRGDLNDYTVTSLPDMRSTGLSMNPGTSAPIGFVYPVDGGGVWRWSGGDTSEHLTPHMTADFWRPGASYPGPGQRSIGPAKGSDPARPQFDMAYGQRFTSCAQWNEWVLFPDWWILDTDTNSWWRLEDISSVDSIHHWSVDWRGRNAYGTPSGFTQPSDPVLYELDAISLRDNYKWGSHPLSWTIDRTADARELILVAQGSGTVTVSVTSHEEPTGTTTQFQVDSWDTFAVRRAPLHTHGSHHQVFIESQSSNPSYHAPRVFEVRVGFNEQARIRR
jgi:hypothetical protein